MEKADTRRREHLRAHSDGTFFPEGRDRSGAPLAPVPGRPGTAPKDGPRKPATHTRFAPYPSERPAASLMQHVAGSATHSGASSYLTEASDAAGILTAGEDTDTEEAVFAASPVAGDPEELANAPLPGTRGKYSYQGRKPQIDYFLAKAEGPRNPNRPHPHNYPNHDQNHDHHHHHQRSLSNPSLLLHIPHVNHNLRDTVTLNPVNDELVEPPRLIPGPDQPHPSLIPNQNDMERVQDAKDLAAFAAWVTLKLIGRRWSLLMDQKSSNKQEVGRSASVSHAGTFKNTLSMHHDSSGESKYSGDNLHVGLPAPENLGSFATFANTIRPSAWVAPQGSVFGTLVHTDFSAHIPAPSIDAETTMSIDTSMDNLDQASNLGRFGSTGVVLAPLASSLNVDAPQSERRASPMALPPLPYQIPLLRRYNSGSQHAVDEYRQDGQIDPYSIITPSYKQPSGRDQQALLPANLSLIPSVTVTERTSGISQHISDFKINSIVNPSENDDVLSIPKDSNVRSFMSPSSSPAMIDDSTRYDASPVAASPSIETNGSMLMPPLPTSIPQSIPRSNRLPSINMLQPHHNSVRIPLKRPYSSHSHFRPFESTNQPIQPSHTQINAFTRPQSFAPTPNPTHVAAAPQPAPTSKYILPPAYISHYTYRLTRLTTLTLLKTPTPPHTTLLALHLLRRLISTPKPLPTRISTPTRMLLGCLVVADCLFGGERGVPSRVWEAIAKVSGLKGEDVNSGGDGVGLGFVAGIKKDVLVSLEFNVHGSLEGYGEWVGTLKELLKDGERGGAEGGDLKRRTKRILEELSVGEGRLGMGWKW